MPIAAFLMVMALQVTAPDEITVTGRPWAPFISPMGEPFRARSASEDTLVSWFTQADGNHDGMLTPAELTADADRFFTLLDTDGNGAIHPEEFVAYEWEIAPEIQVNSRWRRARGEPESVGKTKVMRGKDVDRLQGAARYALLNIPQPVAAADADFDRAVTREEFRLAAAHRFRLLDRAGDQNLTMADLKALVPDPREARRGTKRKDGEGDPRVAIPVPIGD